MAFVLDGEEHIFKAYIYKFIKKHRTPRPKDASKWMVDFQTEFDLAKESRIFNFMDMGCDKYSWNVKRSGKRLQVIGKQNSNDEVIARFEMNKSSRVMHGYPIDYVAKKADKPTSRVLEILYIAGKISKKELIRIMQGKKV